MLEHISFRLLIDYAYNRLENQQLSQQVEEHLDECDICRQALSIAWQIGQTAAQSEGQEPSNSLIERVLKAARRVQNVQSGQRSLPQIEPTLLHDSRVAALPAGVRGGSKERELLFTFEHFELHLSIVQGDESSGYTLWGQLLVDELVEVELEGNQVDLLVDESSIRTVLTDQLGCFRISNLKSGVYGLRISTDTVESVVEEIVIQS